MNLVSKNLIKIFFVVFQFCLSTQNFFAQDSIFFNFDSHSTIYIKEDGSGNDVEELIYSKNVLGNGNILFNIMGNVFIHEKKTMPTILLDNNHLNQISLLSAKEVFEYVKNVREKYPMWYKYPSNKFPKMYIVEKIKGEFHAQEVNWKNYIE